MSPRHLADIAVRFDNSVKNVSKIKEGAVGPGGLPRSIQINGLPGPTFANRPMKYHKILAQCPIVSSLVAIYRHGLARTMKSAAQKPRSLRHLNAG